VEKVVKDSCRRFLDSAKTIVYNMNQEATSRAQRSRLLIISLLALPGVSNGWYFPRRPQSRIPQRAVTQSCFPSLGATNSKLVWSDLQSSERVKVESILNGGQNNVRQQSKWTAWNRRGAIVAGCVVLGAGVVAHAAPDLTGLQPTTEMQPQIPFPDLASLQRQQQQQQALLEGESGAVVVQCHCGAVL
jgi:hypothetical protein